MVQVLPYVPGFGDNLAAAINQGLSGLGQGYIQGLQKKKTNVALQSLQDPKATPLQRVTAFMQLPEELKKSSAPIWASILGPQAQAEADQTQYDKTFGQQFAAGTMPEQPSDQQNIMPSTSAPAQEMGSPGGMMEQGKTPAETPPQSAQKPATDSQLRELLRFKGSKNPLLAGEAFKAESELQARENQKKIEAKKEAEERGIYKKSAESFYAEIEEDRKKLPDLDLSLQAQTDAVLSGDTDPFSRGHIADIAKSLGAPASLTSFLETPGSKEFKTGLKTYLSTTLKDAFRGATTGREIELAESLLAQAGASREANLASLWLLKLPKMIKQERIRLVDELQEQGVSAYKIPRIVDKKLDAYRKDIKDQYFEAIKQLRKK